MAEKWMYPISKTDLDVLRFAHFLALAAITIRFLPKDWLPLSRLAATIDPRGQHSLEIFCLGGFSRRPFRAFRSCRRRRGISDSLSGILIMSGMAG
jgi:hypothetical protein